MTAGRDKVDLKQVRTVPFGEIKRKVSVDSFAKPFGVGDEISDFFSSLPSLLAASDLQELQVRILGARGEGRTVLAMMGAHVIKCGLTTVLIDLVERGIVTAIAMNGAGAIHDFEIALFGETSEEVEDGLKEGTFGMSEETGSLMNRVIHEAAEEGGMGMGEALGSYLLDEKARFCEYSLMAAAVRKEIPLTIHVALGADVIHQHPSCNGASIGLTTYEDFRRFCGVVSGLEGGVVLNMGSAVLLPEVFLKALCIARNLGHEVSRFIAADFDMIRHYRPSKNVVERPTLEGGKGYSFTGHHEIMIPLLAAGLGRGPLDKNKDKG